MIHNPISLDRFDSQSEQRITDGRPYIMCVAMDRPQKNLHTLIRAFDQIKDRFPDHLLVMAGQLRRFRRDRREKSAEIAAEMPPTEELVRHLGLQDRVIVSGFVSDAELGALYRGASVFVLPSLFEGFGMPAVESLALGTPTLVSDLPVLREVTLNGARYVTNPQSASELAAHIAEILNNVDSTRPSRELMNNLRTHYAPETIARQYYDLLVG
jgi:glycosyltransferase involved in cell wall biosynthesis